MATAFDTLLDYGGLSRYDSKIKAYIANMIISETVTIDSSDWSNKTAVLSVSDVLADNLVIVAPAPASLEDYMGASVKCTAQGAGTLTFTCDSVPSVDLDVNVLIINV